MSSKQSDFSIYSSNKGPQIPRCSKFALDTRHGEIADSNPMESSEVQWSPMESSGVQWSPMESSGVQWSPL
ncbi:unnamed protein product, partial [Rotaria sp. Silwood2]